jgi:hypothetical protein
VQVMPFTPVKGHLHKTAYLIMSGDTKSVGRQKLKSSNFCHQTDFVLTNQILLFHVNSPLTKWCTIKENQEGQGGEKAQRVAGKNILFCYRQPTFEIQTSIRSRIYLQIILVGAMKDIKVIKPYLINIIWKWLFTTDPQKQK